MSSFPNLRGEQQVSRGGGKDIAWSRDGSTLYFARGDRQLFAVDFTSVDVFSSQSLVMENVATTMHGGNFDLADGLTDGGDRVLMFAPASAEQEGPLVRLKVVVNWFDEIRARLGGR